MANKEITPAAMEERVRREETTLFSLQIGATYTQTTPLNTGEVGNNSETPDSNWRYEAGWFVPCKRESTPKGSQRAHTMPLPDVDYPNSCREKVLLIFLWQIILLWINFTLTGSQTNPAWVTPIGDTANEEGCFRGKQRKSPCHITPDKLDWCRGLQSAVLTIAITHFSLALTTSPGALITACPWLQSITSETSQ